MERQRAKSAGDCEGGNQGGVTGKKRFLTVISQQPPYQLAAAHYSTEGRNRGSKLEYDEDTSFPIIPVINGYTEEGDAIDLIAIRYDYSHCMENFKTFEKQLQDVCGKKGIECSLTTVTIPLEGSVDVFVKTLNTLLGFFEDGDTVYADISYGLKPMSVLLIMLLQYAYRIRKDVRYGCVVYGEKIWAEKEIGEFESALRIFDVTPLLMIDTVVDMYGNADIRGEGVSRDPGSLIDRLVKGGSEGEAQPYEIEKRVFCGE